MKRIKGEKCKLSDLKVGQNAKIIEINIEDFELKRHLLEMGLTQNTLVNIKKVAPFGEPIVIEVRGYELFLEKYHLKSILVEVM